MSSGELDDEQKYLTRLYARLDELREQTRKRLGTVLATTGLGPQGMAERDVTAGELARELARLDAAEQGLCFGRLDMRDGERRHIGRIGIRGAETGEFPLLIDWRAPAARPFYTATAVSHENVRRRRHLTTRGRTVTAVQDEEFGPPEPAAGAGHPTADSALLAALTAARTGRMTDIVATIQAEQDAVIRSPHTGVLVVQGGPGTGKTAVALHRAAYLLYTQRARLERSVVLVVGPSGTFLRYIADVLPSLGETGALLATLGQLYPGVDADRPEDPAIAEIKGRLVMAEVVAAAVRDRQRVPAEGEALAVEYDDGTVWLGRDACVRVRERVRGARLPHNQARPLFRALLTEELARAYAEQRFATDLFDGSSLLTEADIELITEEMRADPGVRAAVEELWPLLSPKRLLADLFASEEALASAVPGLTDGERALLLREPGAAWTEADVPLLDEAAELLGTDDRAARAAAAAGHADRVARAQEALDVAYGSRMTDFDDGADPEELSAYDVLDAERLAERHEERDHRTPAQRAAADRTWAFGHVVVDEAQELSPMAWRLLMRRCPARSMTIVGDLAQSARHAGTGEAEPPSWQRVLGPHVGDRWRLAELTVNYRLPAEIASVAAAVLRRIDPSRTAPAAVREAGRQPWRREVAQADLAREAARAAAGEAGAYPAGRVGVIVPDALREAVAKAVAEGEAAPQADVLGAREAKGLEFDAVILVDPGLLVAEPAGGLSDLYVALTRPTQSLGVLHPPGRLPEPLERLRPRGAGA